MREKGNTNNGKLSGDINSLITNGSFKFEKITISGKIFENYYLRMHPNFASNLKISDFRKNEIIFNESYFYSFPIKMTQCKYGQTLQIISGTSISACIDCAPGSYSLHTDEVCDICPANANCNTGILSLLPGYWRYGINIHKCLPLIINCL